MVNPMDLYAIYKTRYFDVTFHSNSGTGPEHEGQFSNGSTTNVLTYKYTDVPVVKKAKSDNVIDANTATGEFSTGLNNIPVTIAIPGATYLSVTATYRFSSAAPSSYNYLSIYEGSSASYSSTTGRVAYLASNTKTTQTFTVQGEATRI